MAIGTSSGERYESEFESVVASYQANLQLDPLPDVPSPPLQPSPWPPHPLDRISRKGSRKPTGELGDDPSYPPTGVYPPILPEEEQLFRNRPMDVIPLDKLRKGPYRGPAPVQPGEKLSDATSDEVKAGQQFAMELRRNPIEGRLPRGESSGGKGTETVTEAAVKFKDGYIEKGPSHFDIVQRTEKDLGKAIDGFMTSEGRFVSREEAFRIVNKSGQRTTGRFQYGKREGRDWLGHDDIP